MAAIGAVDQSTSLHPPEGVATGPSSVQVNVDETPWRPVMVTVSLSVDVAPLPRRWAWVAREVTWSATSVISFRKLKLKEVRRFDVWIPSNV